MKKIIIFMVCSVGILYANCLRDNQKEIVVCSDSHVEELTWQDDYRAKSKKLNTADTRNYCATLNSGGGNDWRLPSIEKHRSIIDFTRYNPSINRAFKYTAIDDLYWSIAPGVNKFAF